MPNIHAIILTLNESRHIRRCINSLNDSCASITIVDSGSTDDTVEIARSLGANVLNNPWINYATQMNFAINALAGREGWLFRLDADEVLDPNSIESLLDAVANTPAEVDGILVQRRIHFFGRRIRHGAIEPSWQLRIFRNGKGACEQRWMDEHIKVEGEVQKSGIVISDINLNSLTWWITKHNTYASREAIDALNSKYKFFESDSLITEQTSGQAKVRRFFKERIYGRIPVGGRAWAYFFYRYFIRLGFLDGREGFYFHSLQALWYRTLVDAKISEIEAFAKFNGVSILDAIRERTGIDPLSCGRPNA